jgi:hypothetical protein
MKGRLWIGSLGQFGDWWRARDLAYYDFIDGVLTVDAPEMLNGVIISFPKSARPSVTLDKVQGKTRLCPATPSSRRSAKPTNERSECQLYDHDVRKQTGS